MNYRADTKEVGMLIFGPIKVGNASSVMAQRIDGLLRFWRMLTWSGLLLAPMVGWTVFTAVAAAAVIIGAPLRLMRMALDMESDRRMPVR